MRFSEKKGEKSGHIDNEFEVGDFPPADYLACLGR